MSLMERASTLLKANLNHMMDGAEDPEVMIKQIIRDMDEAIVELRREAVNAVARERHLRRKAEAAGEQAETFETQAGLALDNDDADLARTLLARKLDAVAERDALQKEVVGADALARKLKENLREMQEQAGRARRKQDELIRRMRAAEAQMRTQRAARRSSDALGAATGRLDPLHDARSAFAGYDDQIDRMAAEAEAEQEFAEAEGNTDRKLRKLLHGTEVEKELERLKSSRK